MNTTIVTRLGTPIGPRHKAAIAVLALEDELAAQLMSQLEDADLRALATAVDELDLVPTDALIAVLEELEIALNGPMSVARTGGGAYLRQLATRSLGEDRARRLFAPPPEVLPTAPIEQLKTARTQALADLLVEEHPQIAAVVLTQLPAGTAARVISAMPDDVAADLATRLASIDEVPDRAVLEAAEGIVSALAATGGLASSERRTDFDGLAFAAAIVNEMNGEDGDALLDRMSTRDQEAASRVREAMFTFEDLLRIDARSMAPLLRTVQSETMVTALQTATEALRNHFFSGLSQRAGATLRDDLAASSPRRVSEVEAAQREIVETAMRLATEGTLQLPPRGGEQ